MIKFDFTAKNVLVTGATSGIGAAAVQGFVNSGANVVLSGRDLRRGEAVRQNITQENGRENIKAVFIPGDIRDSDFCNRLVEQAAQEMGSIDVLVNCAGVIFHAIAEDTTDDWWHETMAVNVDGTFFSSRAVVPQMRRAGGGVVINIASDAGLSGSQHLVAYCASKGAVIQITRAMAIDHASDGIRFVAICPGDVDTPMLRGEFKQRGLEPEIGLQQSADGVPLGRVCTPQEVADLVLYAASDSARFMTGTTIALDGGSRA